MADKECETSDHSGNTISTTEVVRVCHRINVNIEALLKDMRAEGCNSIPDMEALEAEQRSLARKVGDVSRILFQIVTSEEGRKTVIVTDSKESRMIANTLFSWFLREEERIEGEIEKHRMFLGKAPGKRPVESNDDAKRNLVLFDPSVDRIWIAIGPQSQAAVAVKDGNPVPKMFKYSEEDQESNAEPKISKNIFTTRSSPFATITTQSNPEEIYKLIDQASNTGFHLSDLICRINEAVRSNNRELTILRKFISALGSLSQNNFRTIVKYVYDASVKADDSHTAKEKEHPIEMLSDEEDFDEGRLVTKTLKRFMMAIVRLDSFLNYVAFFKTRILEQVAVLALKINMNAIEGDVGNIVDKVVRVEYWGDSPSSD